MNTYLLYNQTAPDQDVYLAPNVNTATAHIRGAHAPTVVLPIHDREDLNFAPARTLKKLYELTSGGEPPPSRKAELIEKLHEAIKQQDLKTTYRRGAIGKYARQLIRQGKAPDKVLAAVQRKYPNSRATKKEVYVWRRQVRQGR